MQKLRDVLQFALTGVAPLFLAVSAQATDHRGEYIRERQADISVQDWAASCEAKLLFGALVRRDAHTLYLPTLTLQTAPPTDYRSAHDNSYLDGHEVVSIGITGVSVLTLSAARKNAFRTGEMIIDRLIGPGEANRKKNVKAVLHQKFEDWALDPYALDVVVDLSGGPYNQRLADAGESDHTTLDICFPRQPRGRIQLSLTPNRDPIDALTLFGIEQEAERLDAMVYPKSQSGDSEADPRNQDVALVWNHASERLDATNPRLLSRDLQRFADQMVAEKLDPEHLKTPVRFATFVKTPSGALVRVDFDGGLFHGIDLDPGRYSLSFEVATVDDERIPLATQAEIDFIRDVFIAAGSRP